MTHPIERASVEQAKALWAEQLRTAPAGEYAARSMLESPSANDERVIRAIQQARDAGFAEGQAKARAALQDIAEAEAIPNDAVAFVWCRQVAREALSAEANEGRCDAEGGSL